MHQTSCVLYIETWDSALEERKKITLKFFSDFSVRPCVFKFFLDIRKQRCFDD